MNSSNLLKEYLKLVISEGGESAERQERGLIDTVNKIASENSPISVITPGASIKGVIGATKMPDLSKLGQEPYTDVVFNLSNGGTANISAKGPTAPSLAGGGLVALQLLVPDLISRFLQAASEAYAANGYKHGSADAPDVFGKISDEDSLLILRGDEPMGGPIDYMYQGPMDVVATHEKNSVSLNGVLTPIEEYAATHKFYLRVRKRRVDQPLDLKTLDANGLPLLFGRSPSRGDSGRRIVIAGRPSGKALIVDI